MKIVIDIPESILNTIQADEMISREQLAVLQMHILNGKPLPKCHGDLITKEQAIDLVEFYQLNPQHFDFVNLIDEIKDEKPIIEADKAESEDK